MKTALFTCLIVCIATTVVAQEDYEYVDNKIIHIPSAKTYTTDSIAHYILEYCKTDIEKIRAAYTWITRNVEYSKDSMYYFRRWGTDPEEKMAAILRRRKGVCENYAGLFANIVTKCGVQAVVVTGYTKTGGNINRSGHGWVAVNAGGNWLLCDPTWDAGRNNSYNYFLVSPAAFINTHMPFDPLWQLLDHPVSHQQFARGLTYGKDTAIFHYKDSVTAYLQSDTLQQMEATSRRMLSAGMDNDDLKIWHTYNQMKINIVYQEENMQLFNEAVEELNKAKKIYNELVQYRNNEFTLAKKTQEINAMFASIDKLIASSYQKMEAVGKKAENYQYDTEGLKEELDKLSLKLKTQQEFIQQYLNNTSKAKQR